MGLIKDFIEWRKTKRLDSIEGKAIEAVKNPEKNSVEEIWKLIEENPELKSEIFELMVKSKKIDDRFVEKPIEDDDIEINANDIRQMMKDLDPKIKINGERALQIANKIRENVEDLNEQISFLGTLKRNARMNDEQLKEFEIIEKEIRQELNEIQEKEDRQIKSYANKKITLMYNNHEKDYWSNQRNFYEINQKIIDDFENSNPTPEELKMFRDEVAKLIAKKKAYDYARNGSTIIYDSGENMNLENMLTFDIPGLAQEEYKKISDDKKEYKYKSINKELTQLIVEKIARNYIFDYHRENEQGEFYVPAIVSMIEKNNPKMSKEQLQEIEDNFIKQIEILSDKLNMKNIDTELIRRQLVDNKEKSKIINDIRENLEIQSEEDVEIVSDIIKGISGWSKEEKSAIKDYIESRNKKIEKAQQDKIKNSDVPNFDDNNEYR